MLKIAKLRGERPLWRDRPLSRQFQRLGCATPRNFRLRAEGGAVCLRNLPVPSTFLAFIKPERNSTCPARQKSKQNSGKP